MAAQNASTPQTATAPPNPLMMLVNAATSQYERPSTPPTMASQTLLTPPSVKSSIKKPAAVRRNSGSTKLSFADAMMHMLLDEEYSKIVTFLPDDQSWGITNAKLFVEQVMPKVFGIRTFSSFVRKLNRWGFERIMEKKTHDVDVFRHVHFKKGDWESCRNIKCIGRLAKAPSEMTTTQQLQEAAVITPPHAVTKRSLNQASYALPAVAATPPMLYSRVSSSSIGSVMPPPPTVLEAQISSQADELELHYLAQRRAEILARKYGLGGSGLNPPMLFY